VSELLKQFPLGSPLGTPLAVTFAGIEREREREVSRVSASAVRQAVTSRASTLASTRSNREGRRTPLSLSLPSLRREASLKAPFTPDGRLRERSLVEIGSAGVLLALMETRSCELPLTAAKPIYLRPRFFLGYPLRLVPPAAFCSSLSPPRGLWILLVTEFVPNSFFLSLSLSRFFVLSSPSLCLLPSPLLFSLSFSLPR